MIKGKYCDQILNEAAHRYQFDKGTVHKVNDYTYEYELGDQHFMLICTSNLQKSVDLVRNEVHWVSYLAEHGASITRPVISNHQNLVEVVEFDDASFAVVSYEKAKGKHVGEKDWNVDLFQKWGRAIGKIHALTKIYEPPNNAIKGKQWYESDCFINAEQYLPSTEEVVLKKLNVLISDLRQLPTPKDAYGFTHSNPHQWNFFVDDGEITFFDFDKSEYCWFVNDIAVALYYAVWQPLKKGEKESFARYFLDHFLEGYSQETTIDSFWLETLPDFLKLRDFFIYLNFYRHNPDNINEDQRNILKKYKKRIENDIPCVNIDLSV